MRCFPEITYSTVEGDGGSGFGENALLSGNLYRSQVFPSDLGKIPAQQAAQRDEQQRGQRLTGAAVTRSRSGWG